ncbi:MAG: flagellar basal-body rod protein FlgF [bacterium]
MVKGIYHSAKAMLAGQHHLEVVANNLANASTVGFKQEEIAFRQTLDQSSSSSNPSIAGEKFVTAERGGQGTFKQGVLRETGNPLHVAILGDGYFTVETGNGPAYTRDGRFQLNPEGELVTLSGHRVITAGGTLQIPDGDLRISSDGELVLENEKPAKRQILDRLLVVSFNDPAQLRPVHDGLLTTQQKPGELEEPRLRVGYLEESNVNMVSQMVEMIQIHRFYEASAKAISTQDQILGKAVNEVGKVQ